MNAQQVRQIVQDSQPRLQAERQQAADELQKKLDEFNAKALASALEQIKTAASAGNRQAIVIAPLSAIAHIRRELAERDFVIEPYIRHAPNGDGLAVRW